MLKEFKPALLFVAKFLAIYFVGNILYGIYVESFNQVADPITNWVTLQSVEILNNVGEVTEAYEDEFVPNIHILLNDRSVISIYEGCNGVNVMVIFIAFLIAFGGKWIKMLWFIPVGIIGIHLTNLTRIVLLFFVAEYHPNLMYFTHKYLFTGFIYAFVLLLWYLWATRISK